MPPGPSTCKVALRTLAGDHRWLQSASERELARQRKLFSQLQHLREIFHGARDWHNHVLAAPQPTKTRKLCKRAFVRETRREHLATGHVVQYMSHDQKSSIVTRNSLLRSLFAVCVCVSCRNFRVGSCLSIPCRVVLVMLARVLAVWFRCCRVSATCASLHTATRLPTDTCPNPWMIQLSGHQMTRTHVVLMMRRVPPMTMTVPSTLSLQRSNELFLPVRHA